MDFNQYQALCAETAVYLEKTGRGTTSALVYTLLGLSGESGELANKVKKVIRGDRNAGDPFELASELGDVLWYVAETATNLGFSLEEIASRNIEKLRKRKLDGTIHGSGDHR